MRYHFRGLQRETGKPVEGHVEAPTSHAAYEVLGNNGVVTERLTLAPRPEDVAALSGIGGGQRGAAPSVQLTSTGRPRPIPRPDVPPASSAPPPTARSYELNEPTATQARPMFAQRPEAPPNDQASALAEALESAFTSAGRQLSVDDLAQRYRGQRVWVLDGEKIRQRVMDLIDRALQQGQRHKESHEEVRERIAAAIEDMFKDKRNLASQQQQQERQQQQQQQQGSVALQQQVDRLSRVVEGLERAVANMSMVMRSGGPVHFGQRPRRHRTQEHRKVLLEIFETNLELRRGMEGETFADNGVTPPAEPAPEPEPAVGQRP